MNDNEKEQTLLRLIDNVSLRVNTLSEVVKLINKRVDNVMKAIRAMDEITKISDAQIKLLEDQVMVINNKIHDMEVRKDLE